MSWPDPIVSVATTWSDALVTIAQAAALVCMAGFWFGWGRD